MFHFTPKQLEEHLTNSEQTLTLLDVREPWEFDVCHINGSTLIPMGQIPNKLESLDKDQPIVIICHHGIRSRQVGMFLEHNGFQHVINLDGGVDAWAMEVDQNMAKY